MKHLLATYPINRLPSKVIGNSTPLERLYHQKPDYNSLIFLGVHALPISIHTIVKNLSNVTLTEKF